MKLVLDTNIFISALYWGGKPQEIIDRIIKGIDELYISEEILNEIASVMTRPNFKSTPKTIEEYLQTLKKIGKEVVITGKITGICRDKDDDDKLECGALSGADYIITGDKDLLALESYQHTKIVTVNKYLDMISDPLFE